jgi:hypothetical protein
MLTQIQDTDFPQALADTVETDENGELVTLTKILNQIEWVKDEISSEIADVKKEITDVKVDIKATEKASQLVPPVEEVEVIEPAEEDKLIEEPVEKPIEEPKDKEDATDEEEKSDEKLEESFGGKDLKTAWAEMKNQPIMEFPNGHVVYLEPDYDRNVIVYGGMTNGGIIPEGEIEYDDTMSLDWHIQGIYDELIQDNFEEEIEESYSKYIRKGYLEDLNQTKREIDNQVRQGKSAKDIKNTIIMKSDNEKEQDEAENYAIDKLKESLLNTQYSAQIQIRK